MRIAGGKWKVVQLRFDGKGLRDQPLIVRVRAIASSILASRGLDLSESRVLDAFAEFRAMGFELLSRALYIRLLIKTERRVIALSVRLSTLGVSTSE